MKCLIISIVLLSLIGCFLFASDETESSLNTSINAGISTLFLAKPESLEDSIPLHPLTFSSFLIGFGGQLRIIPHVLSPGLYGDIHISLLSMLITWLTDNAANKTDTNDFLFFQTGIRLYNQFTFNPVYIQPFFGLNLLGVLAEKSAANWYKAFGILIGYNKIGIEYSYQMPILHHINDPDRAIHRIAVVFRFSSWQ